MSLCHSNAPYHPLFANLEVLLHMSYYYSQFYNKNIIFTEESRNKIMAPAFHPNRDGAPSENIHIESSLPPKAVEGTP